MYVHIGGIGNEKVLCFLKIKHVNAKKSKKPSMTFPLHSNKGPTVHFDPNSPHTLQLALKSFRVHEFPYASPS